MDKSDYEIIAVNDGSGDRSAEIIRRLQESYPNIRLIDKENGGLGSARNAGMEEARGAYIWFVDSDDSIDANVLQALLDKAQAENLDFLGFGHKEIYPGMGKTVCHPSPRPGTVIDNIAYLSGYPIHISSCFHIAKREVYENNQLRFAEGILHEDYEFMLRFYPYCGRIGFVDLYPYNYLLKKEGSITTNKEPSHYMKRLDSWIWIIHSLAYRFDRGKDETEYAYHARKWVNTFNFHALTALLFAPLRLDDKLRYYRLYQDNGCFPKGTAYRLSLRRSVLYRVFRIPFLYKVSLCLFHVIGLRR